jgi:hypothetical protein
VPESPSCPRHARHPRHCCPALHWAVSGHLKRPGVLLWLLLAAAAAVWPRCAPWKPPPRPMAPCRQCCP